MLKKTQNVIRRAQQESQILRELSRLYAIILVDDTRLSGMVINRVKLSPDKSVCRVFLYTPESSEIFQKQLGVLILYKPSLRKALASTLDSRRVPELIFSYDDTFEKQRRIDSLLEEIRESNS